MLLARTKGGAGAATRPATMPVDPRAKAPERQPKGDGAELKIAELRQQKIAVAEKAKRLAEEMFRAGVGEAGEVFRTSQQVLQARLEAAKTGDERVSLLKAYVVAAKQGEQLAEQRHKTGTGRTLDLELARYQRIEAELQLLLEEAR